MVTIGKQHPLRGAFGRILFYSGCGFFIVGKMEERKVERIRCYQPGICADAQSPCD